MRWKDAPDCETEKRRRDNDAGVKRDNNPALDDSCQPG
jgi:hypothetical protein